MRGLLIVAAVSAASCATTSKQVRKLDPQLCAPLAQVLNGRPDKIELCGKIPSDGLMVLEAEEGDARIPIDPLSVSCVTKSFKIVKREELSADIRGVDLVVYPLSADEWAFGITVGLLNQFPGVNRAGLISSCGDSGRILRTGAVYEVRWREVVQGHE